jgi:hypothetical protein
MLTRQSSSSHPHVISSSRHQVGAAPHRTKPRHRSGYVAANGNAKKPASSVAITTARDEPTASITALMSSMRASIGGTSGGANRSDRPAPLGSITISRPSEARSRRKRARGTHSQLTSR